MVAVTIVIAAMTVGSGGEPIVRQGATVPVAAMPHVFQVAEHPPVVNAPGSVNWGVGDPTAPLWASTPVRLVIPAIGVDSGLMELGLTSAGVLETPPSGFPAGWYTGAPTPGEVGPAIIVGHVDWNGPGVFFNLGRLVAGDQVSATREDGSVANFTVTETVTYLKDAFPTALVYGGLTYAGLRLITCGGTFNPTTGHYEDNIVVYAELTSSIIPGRVDRPASTQPLVLAPMPVVPQPRLVIGRREV